MNQPVLILSATINPSGMFALKQCDPQARKLQYLNAVRFWLKQPSSAARSIVLVENSGSDLSDFQRLADLENPSGNSLELISLAQNDYPRELGKGYGEFQMIDAAVERSRLIAESNAVAKITGRLVVENYAKIVANLPASYDLVCDAYLVKADPNGGRIDSRLTFFSTQFYKQHVSGLYRKMNDTAGYYAEHAFFELMQKCDSSAKLFSRLPIEPHWNGYSGSTGADYGDFRARLKRPFKSLRRMWDRSTNQPSLHAIKNAGNTQNTQDII